MIRQLDKFAGKLLADGCADPQQIAILALDDDLLSRGTEALLPLGAAVIERLNVVSLVLAAPPLPLIDLLLARTPTTAVSIVPQDTETRTFLHDIPIVRRHEYSLDNAQRLVELLGQRKGILVEGVGIMASGSVTVEQAYINYSSVYHALFVKLLLMLLTEQPAPSADEMERLTPLWQQLENDIPDRAAELIAAPLTSKETILQAMDQVGKQTVALKLVDSFFGNISCSQDNSLYI